MKTYTEKRPPRPGAPVQTFFSENRADALLVAEFEEWLVKYRGRAVATAAKYTTEARRLIAWARSNGQGPEDLERPQLEQYVGMVLFRAGLSARARKPAVSALRSFYGWMQHTGRIGASPAADLQHPKAGRALPRALSLRSAEKLMMAPDLDTFLGVRDAAVLSVLIGCGLRLSGATALNERDLLWLEDASGRERLVISAREKGGHQRYVPAPDECRLLVRAYLGHPELDTIDRLLPNGDRVLFVSTNWQIPPDQYHGEARRLSPRAVQSMMVRYGERVGIPRAELHPHAARHLYGAELAEDDVTMLIAQALLGHVDPSSTEVYAHLAHRKLARIVDASNPLGKVMTPVSELSRTLRAHKRAPRVRVPPRSAESI